ncbi:MAG: TIR domain-containing protein [Dehalococcoidia bacterium]|jgi:hypothetical protein
MGGSGGGGQSLNKDELRALEEAARASLREAAEPKKRNVFISFVEEDLAEVNLLRGQAKNENTNLEFNDWSLKEPFDSENAEYVRRGIRERIRQSSVTVCYITENTTRSKWVDWEIRESIRLGKGVIAMYKGDKPPLSLPPAIVELDIKVIPWNHMEITRAIDNAVSDKN